MANWKQDLANRSKRRKKGRGRKKAWNPFASLFRRSTRGLFKLF